MDAGFLETPHSFEYKNNMNTKYVITTAARQGPPEIVAATTICAGMSHGPHAPTVKVTNK